MSFIIKKNLSNINKKLIFFIQIINIIFLFYIKKFINLPNKYDYYIGNIMDMRFPILVAYSIFSYIIYIYISLKLYKDSLEQSTSLLFTRTNFQKWNMINIISILLITLFIKFLQFIFYPICIYKGLNHFLILISLILLFIEYIFYNFSYILFLLIIGMMLAIKLPILFILIIIIQLNLLKNKKVGDLKI